MSNHEWHADAERLRELAGVLKSCRDVYMAVWHEGLGAACVEARKGSQAYCDFHREEHGPGGVWPDWIAPQTRTIAAKLVRQQADFCVSTGILIESGELFEPIYSLARSAFECGLRAYWLLDMDADLRRRCARARLMELVSVHHLREAASEHPDATDLQDDLAAMKAGWRTQRKMVESLFTTVELSGDPGKWSLEGAGYESWTDIAGRWMRRFESNTPGGWLYKL